MTHQYIIFRFIYLTDNCQNISLLFKPTNVRQNRPTSSITKAFLGILINIKFCFYFTVVPSIIKPRHFTSDPLTDRFRGIKESITGVPSPFLAFEYFEHFLYYYPLDKGH